MKTKKKLNAIVALIVALVMNLVEEIEVQYTRARSQVMAYRFVTNIKAEGQGNVVGVLVGLMVSLLIAIVVVMNLITSQTQAGWSAQANSTWLALTGNIWVALTLLVIAPIIVGAVIILGYVRRGM